jgi:hypothetical protein
MAGHTKRGGYTSTWLGAVVLTAFWLFGIVTLFVLAALIMIRRSDLPRIRWDEEESGG